MLNDYDQYNTRIDENLGSKDRVMGRFSYIKEPYFQSSYAPLAGEEAPLHDYVASLQYTRVISPRAVNEFRFSYTRSAAGYSQQPVSQNLDAQIGLTNTTTNPVEFGLPSVSVAGYGGFGSFSPTISNTTDRFQWSDDFTYTLGKHGLKMGIDFRRLRYRQRSAQDPRGTISYAASFSNPGPGLAGGSALADFLLGTPASWQLELEDLGFDGRMIQPGLYFQDNYKVTQRLSLTLGVRWEYCDSPWVQPRNNAGIFNFSTQQIEYILQNPFNYQTSTQVGNAVPRALIYPQYDNFADRIGLAYRVMNNTVIRAGHGVYWNNVNNNQLTQSMSLYYPFVYLVSQSADTSQLTPLQTNASLYPARPAPPALPYGPAFTLYTVQRTFRRPYTEQWNFNIQRTFGNNYLFEVGYMGNQSHKLPEATNYNQASLPNPNIPFAAQPLQPRRPYPAYGKITVFDHMGNANYNGLTAKFEKHYSSGFSFLTAYTWSKAIDSSTDINSDDIKAPGDAKSYRSLAALDTGQRFVGSYTYALPFGKGQRLGGQAGGAANAFIGGWQLNGITTFSLGVPFGVTEPATTPNVDALYVLTNRTCNGTLPRGQRTRLEYFNTSCFSVSAPGTFGTSARNPLRGPGVNDWDISAFKNFPLWSERWKLQFRVRGLQPVQPHAVQQSLEFAPQRDDRGDFERQISTYPPIGAPDDLLTQLIERGIFVMMKTLLCSLLLFAGAKAAEPSALTSAQFAQKAYPALPVEQPYAFHKELTEWVEPLRRSPAAKLAADEIEIPREGWSLIIPSQGGESLRAAAGEFRDYLLRSMRVRVTVQRGTIRFQLARPWRRQLSQGRANK